MSIRHLIVAALAASACVAHADVIPASNSASQSGFLSSWTTGNGTDVVGSGVFSGLNLIGGISHSEAAKASGSQGTATLADVLYGKASASLGQSADGQTKLYFQQGIEGTYLLGAGHGILAAMLGNGVSVVGSADGVVVTRGPQAGGGAGGGAAGGGGAGGGGGGSAGGGAGNGGTTGGGNDNGAIVTHPGNGGPVVVTLPPQAQLPKGPVGPHPTDPVTEVPEPSSIALLLAGVLGAGSVVRRRRR